MKFLLNKRTYSYCERQGLYRVYVQFPKETKKHRLCIPQSEYETESGVCYGILFNTQLSDKEFKEKNGIKK